MTTTPAPARSTTFGETSPKPAETTTADTRPLTERYEALRQTRNSLHERRVQREAELGLARKTEEQCAREAAALGVNSIEELQDLIKRQEQQDEEALNKLEAELEAEENTLRQVDERVAQIDAR